MYRTASLHWVQRPESPETAMGNGGVFELLVDMNLLVDFSHSLVRLKCMKGRGHHRAL